jgi:hypothetical protein
MNKFNLQQLLKYLKVHDSSTLTFSSAVHYQVGLVSICFNVSTVDGGPWTIL